MTEDFEKTFELANLMTVVNNQKIALLDEFEQATLFFYNGGCFKIDQQLISFLVSLKLLNQTSTVLIDKNKMPIFIEDLSKFINQVTDCYFNASNKYLAEYQKLQQNRNIKSILDL